MCSPPGAGLVSMKWRWMWVERHHHKYSKTTSVTNQAVVPKPAIRPPQNSPRQCAAVPTTALMNPPTTNRNARKTKPPIAFVPVPGIWTAIHKISVSTATVVTTEIPVNTGTRGWCKSLSNDMKPSPVSIPTG